MRTARSIAATIIVATTFTACKRESETVVAPLPAPTSSQSSTSSSTTTAAADTSTGSSTSSGAPSPGVVSTAPEYTQSMEQLQKGAQRLREAIQAMAQQPVGERRNQAIKEAHQALRDTNQAMVQLPPEMRTQSGATGTTSSQAGGTAGTAVYPGSDADYTRAMEKLQQGAQNLRESIQALAQEPVGPLRDAAIKNAHQALYDTNQAMIQLPPGSSSDKK